MQRGVGTSWRPLSRLGSDQTMSTRAAELRGQCGRAEADCLPGRDRRLGTGARPHPVPPSPRPPLLSALFLLSPFLPFHPPRHLLPFNKNASRVYYIYTKLLSAQRLRESVKGANPSYRYTPWLPPQNLPRPGRMNLVGSSVLVPTPQLMTCQMGFGVGFSSTW